MARTLTTVVGLAVLAGGVAPARAADTIVVKPARGVEAPVGKDKRVDHTVWHKLLKRYVDAQGRVDYRAWKKQGRPTLDRYLQSLAAVKPAALADKNERLAFWINAYNALTIKGMLHFYPTTSIKKHTSVLWGFHFFDDVRLVVAGAERSVDHIEHKILRKMQEPRIHFAIVCASTGCPRLRAEAYTGPTVQTQLASAARDFFNTRKHFRIDRAKRTVWFSKILKWFGADFGGTDQKLLRYAARQVLNPADRAFLQGPDLDVEFLDYDWSINKQPKKKSAKTPDPKPGSAKR